MILILIASLTVLSIFILLRKLPHKKRQRIMIVLGSGGHTTEMLYTLQYFDFDKMQRVVFALADTDKTSVGKSQNFFSSHKVNIRNPQFITVPRSRQVKQFLITSIFTTLKSIALTFVMVAFKGFRDIDMLVMNGPGTCVPFALVYFILNKLRVTNTKMVFIESWCRVDRLSITGRLLKPIVHQFIVHWDELKTVRGCQYYGPII